MGIERNRTLERRVTSKILFVAEGTVTEPTYIDLFREHFKIPERLIVFKNVPNVDPKGLVEQVLQARQEMINNKSYNPGSGDRSFVLCDVKEHIESTNELITKSHFNNAIQSIKKFDDVYLITSNPCFEYWLLLHFGFFQSAMTAEEACEKLKRQSCFESFNKHISRQMFLELEKTLLIAISNGNKTAELDKNKHNSNPHSYMSEFMSRLKFIKDRVESKS